MTGIAHGDCKSSAKPRHRSKDVPAYVAGNSIEAFPFDHMTVSEVVVVSYDYEYDDAAEHTFLFLGRRLAS